jgi:hypothetical protein
MNISCSINPGKQIFPKLKILFTVLKAMANLINDSYCFTVLPGTRDHKGYFVQDTSYTLVEMDSSGWARICLDSAACYYVDPANLQELR